MTAYYNEHDEYAAEWLRNLIKAGHIAYGHVDTRSIVDVAPGDLAGFTQCHFFAGIGVWSHALRGAGWPDDRPVWTGSCPCQPFSQAGAGAGFADERHLWPHFHHLIRQCRPPVVFGEQVASQDGLGWIDLVQADMEAEAYAFAAFDLCAAGFGAPHIRQRLYWVADAAHERHAQWCQQPSYQGDESGPRAASVRRDDTGELAISEHGRCEAGQPQRTWSGTIVSSGVAGQLGNPNSGRPPARRQTATSDGHGRPTVANGGRHAASPTDGFWRDADWLLCRDGKWRPVEPGTFPLAHGAAARVGRLRAYGNAIVAPQARAFVEAYLQI